MQMAQRYPTRFQIVQITDAIRSPEKLRNRELELKSKMELSAEDVTVSKMDSGVGSKQGGNAPNNFGRKQPRSPFPWAAKPLIIAPPRRSNSPVPNAESNAATGSTLKRTGSVYGALTAANLQKLAEPVTSTRSSAAKNPNPVRSTNASPDSVAPPTPVKKPNPFARGVKRKHDYNESSPSIERMISSGSELGTRLANGVRALNPFASREPAKLTGVKRSSPNVLDDGGSRKKTSVSDNSKL